MQPKLTLLAIVLLLSPVITGADCPRVPGQEETRRANAGCVILRGNKVLLLTHRWGGKLGVPGGTLEPGEQAQCTAYRETQEETGLQVRVGRRLQVMKNGFHLYRCHAASLPEEVNVPFSGLNEVKALGWYRLEQLRREQWRYPYQFDLFRETVRAALAAERSQSGS